MNGQGSSTSILTPGSGFPTFQQLTASQQIQWFGTVRPRLGWLATDNLLLYGTGGFAYGRVSNYANYGLNGHIIGISFLNYGFLCTPTFTSPSGVVASSCMGGTSTPVARGWTAGGGMEYRVPGTKASFKAEYLYVNLGAGSVMTGASPVIPFPATLASSMSFAFSRTDFHTVRLGLNWHL
jgi:outer membrane immunogenic protein